MDAGEYPNFDIAMSSPATFVSPPLILMAEMMRKYQRTVPNPETLTGEHSDVMNSIFKTMMLIMPQLSHMVLN